MNSTKFEILLELASLLQQGSDANKLKKIAKNNDVAK